MRSSNSVDETTWPTQWISFWHLRWAVFRFSLTAASRPQPVFEYETPSQSKMQVLNGLGPVVSSDIAAAM